MTTHYSAIAATLPHSMIMPDTGNAPSLEAAVAYIEQMDLSLIKEKLCSNDPLLCRQWTPIEAEIAIQYYKNFLFLNKKYQAIYPVLPPPLEVDEIWHHHILDTRTYMDACQHIFGHYFHHYPYFGARGKEDADNLNIAFDVVQALHNTEFGHYMITLWERRT